MPRKKSFQVKKIFVPILAISIIFNLYFLVNKYLPFLQGKNNTVSGNVARIVDGDTFDLKDNTRIRLAGVNAPEYPQGCLAQESKDRLENLILDQAVDLKEIGKDNFGRTVAYVFLDDVLIDKVLVQEGLAQAQSNSDLYDPEILSAQEDAQKILKGIWSSQCQPKKPDENCKIKGNFRKDRNTEIYHTPDCYNYEKIVINEAQRDQWFCSPEEAETAGFVKSKDCP